MLQANRIFIGGSPCAGKSTVSGLLSRDTGWKVHHCDDTIQDHLKRAHPKRHPVMFAMARMSWEEMFMQDPLFQVQQEFLYYEEEFSLFLEDLESYGMAPLIAEGTGLLPKMVAHLGVPPKRAVFLVPTPRFQLRYYAKRPYPEILLRECKDPRTAYKRWMKRDMLFADRVEKEALEEGYPVIRVDLGQKAHLLYEAVWSHLDI
ncbi:MAG TPA: hypothetical protein PLF44_04515 [Candidatus Mcinerneyibacteriales bacterium]|nr:hypothetical protein [Candidatus Mcinerneyibacteriales bacterium]HPE21321.1 hypothetical protein [Candidatus Mcinerneyibacteriales bacterium]HPJ70124.1 hypothetical protein [Candidatus Mcinerneyibacteriales bacterium]HPQ89010.1 hypothetical protein [Candidatus Mcinerneyibacteriales bacterium]